MKRRIGPAGWCWTGAAPKRSSTSWRYWAELRTWAVRALEEQLEVFLEGENAAVLEEVAAHHRAHLLEEILRAHGRLLLTRLAGSTPAHIGPRSLAPPPTGAPLVPRTAARLLTYGAHAHAEAAHHRHRPRHDQLLRRHRHRGRLGQAHPLQGWRLHRPLGVRHRREGERASSATRPSASGSSIQRTPSTAASASWAAAGRARSSRRCARPSATRFAPATGTTWSSTSPAASSTSRRSPRAS